MIANADAGRDGMYLTQQPDARDRPLPARGAQGEGAAAAGHPAGALGLLHGGKRLEKWLREPDVGLALDPEWRMAPGQVPGDVIGRVDAREVNARRRGSSS